MKGDPAARHRVGGRAWAAFVDSMESRLWPVPLTIVIAAVVLGIVMPRLDLIVDPSLPDAVDSTVFNGGADTARSVLSSIAGSLITATSLTFSLTVVALQLASSQASPRVLRLFARDRQVHWTLAAFLGTFAYSITVLRAVRSADDNSPEFVPRISVTIAFVLTLVSVVMLVFFLSHLAAQLRVDTMLKDIHADTDRTIDLVGARNEAAVAYAQRIRIPSTRHTVSAEASGFITGHDHDRLLTAAGEHGVVVQEIRRVGENVVVGTPLAHWWPVPGSTDGVDDGAVADAVRRAYPIGYERTAAEDVDFGVQQIVDIALRALSSGVNDPTTAVHALGHLTSITARIVRMPPLPAGLADADGELRVITVPRTQGGDVDAALSPLRHYGADQPAVVARFVAATRELSYLCDHPDVDTALLAQLDALEEQLRGIRTDPASTNEAIAAAAEARERILERRAGRL